MSLIEQYKEPKDILLKMLRDGHKTYNSNNEEDVSDCFFGFCVTSHSLRDWVIKSLNLKDKQINDFHEECNKNSYLVACRDIANSSKHGGLDTDRAKSTVSNVNVDYSELVPIYPDGIPRYDLIHSKKMIHIRMADGQEIMILTFIVYTARAWFDIFDKHHISRDGAEEILNFIPIRLK